MSRKLLYAGVAVGLLLGASSARAADVSPAQATSLENQVRDWLGGLLGPAVKISDRPVAITPAGDHFDVKAPITLGQANAGQAIQVTATARPLDGGKWSIENVKAVSPLTFTVEVPVPPKDAPPPKPGAPKPQQPQPTMVPIRYTVDIKGQDGRIIWDPSFATPSTWTSSTQSATIHAEGGPMTQDSAIGPTTALATLRPAGPDRVDMISEATLQDYKIAMDVPNSGAIDLGMKRIRVNMALNGVSRTKGLSIVQGLTSLIALGMAPGQAPATPPKIAPEMMRSLLDALQDFASDFSLDETIDGLAVRAQDKTVLMDRLKIGFAAKSATGLLQASMEMGMEGLGLPELPLGGLEALIPRRLALRPVVSGLGVAELTNMAKASGEGRSVTPADIAALFSHGGIKAGLESMALELGGATFTGQGKVVMTSPERFSGDAQIVAENFDGLMQKVSGIPAAAQAVPVLVMAKGIGRAQGATLVWDVSYHDGKILVNNVDLAAMAGGGAPAPAPARPNQQRPQSPQQNRTR